MKPPIIITGTPRSGIWLLAGAFEAAQAFGGTLDWKGKQPGDGENIEIRDRLERPLLEGIGCEPRGYGMLPSVNRIKGLACNERFRLTSIWRETVDNIFTAQGCPDGAVRFIASRVACLLWPLWHAAFPEARWIIVRRDDADIINSCKATGFIESYRTAGESCRRVRTEKELRLLIDGYQERFGQMEHAALSLQEFWPQQLFDGKLDSLRIVLEANDLGWRPEVAEFVRPHQWKRGTLEVEGADHATRG